MSVKAGSFKSGGLVITRQAGEQILVGNDIVISVARIHNGRVRLHVIAPKDVSIDRPEIRASKEGK